MAATPSSSQPRWERLKVVWISDYPIEWLSNLPRPLRGLQRQHPATWARVLLGEFQRRGDVEVHVIAFRSRIDESVTFEVDDRQAQVEESLAQTQLEIAREKAENELATDLAEKQLAQQQQIAKQHEITREVASRKANNEVRILASKKAESVGATSTGCTAR